MGVYLGRMHKPCDVWFAGHFKIQSTLCSPNQDCGRPNEPLRVRFPGKHFSRAWVLYLGYESLKSASRKRTLNGSFGLPQSWFGEHALDSSTCVSSAAFQNRRLGSVRLTRRLTRRLCTSDSLPLPTRFGLRITAIQSPILSCVQGGPADAFDAPHSLCRGRVLLGHLNQNHLVTPGVGKPPRVAQTLRHPIQL